ncbi:molybdenum cofactor guanylyltransferase [Luteolibacter luteus]|uniref:Probable molybdenum cofactor guanylyltransferase n=1 Tax=Luteolibacter luteus TaxID=2728835 RepID=A0A858RNF9_9BACT|nr:molybdenum cofactor guanylyltransferase [Luteolibacter luteus]QJE98265.1 molybdenum cofactor guanylyltransferase [Luteolibacter luteus]
MSLITVILAGGKSSRMGREKARIERPDGERQIDFLVSLARLAGDEIYLSLGNDSVPPVDLPVIRDQRAGVGPLAALAAAHAAHPVKSVLLLGCDLFMLDAETIRHLAVCRDPSRQATCYSNRLDGRPEPLCAIYEAHALAKAEEWITRDDFRARFFLESLEPLMLELPHPAALDNVNTPHELEECFSKLREGVVSKTVTVQLDDEPPQETLTLANTIGGLFEEVRFQQRLRKRLDEVLIFKGGSSAGAGKRLHGGEQIRIQTVSSPDAGHASGSSGDSTG